MNQTPQIQSLTQEQFNLFVKLEEIFMPEAKRQRDAFIAKQRLEGQQDDQMRFVHYTSAEAALNIIKSRRMWMRNTNCMSDYREVQHGLDMLNKFFGDEARRNTFISALDECAPGAAQEAINMFNQKWNDIRFNTYVASISEHDSCEDQHGRLSMWRAFGGNSAQVALVFKVPRFSNGAIALGLMFSPVSYLTGEQVQNVVHEIIEKTSDNCAFLKTVNRQMIVGMVFNVFLCAVTCLKHEGFKEEREWRAIFSPKIASSPLMEVSTEVVRGIPQPVYKVPLDVRKNPILVDLDFPRMFDRLIIGPSQYSLPMSEAFREELKAIGVADAETRVWPSLIPIRT